MSKNLKELNEAKEIINEVLINLMKCKTPNLKGKKFLNALKLLDENNNK